jgi:hypothetical protein
VVMILRFKMKSLGLRQLKPQNSLNKVVLGSRLFMLMEQKKNFKLQCG